MPLLSKRTLLVAGVPVVAVVAGLAWYAWWARSGDSSPAIGMVRTTEIRIAPEISGRLARFLVKPGEAVQRGQPVALLANPELWAAVDLARAEVDKARSDRDRVYAGIRDEQVQMLEREIHKAEAVHTQAAEELRRKAILVVRSDVSQQDFDEAKASEAHALADIAVGQARYAEGKLGPTEEERALADATVAAVEAARDVVEARAAKMLLRAPAPGTLAILVAEIGEAVVPGEPVLTLMPNDGSWLGFNIREDALAGLTIGSMVSVRRSGETSPLTAKVTEMRNQGAFATWQAARASGDHDLNTFFVRADLASSAPALDGGGTVWLERSAPKN